MTIINNFFKNKLELQKDKRIIQIYLNHCENNCLNCGNKIKIISKLELCQDCSPIKKNEKLIKILHNYLKGSFFDLFEGERIGDDPNVGSKNSPNSCLSCEEIEIFDEDLHLCKDCYDLIISPEKVNKYPKKYNKKLKQENRCTTCHKSKNRPLIKYLMVKYVFFNVLVNLKSISDSLNFTRKKSSKKNVKFTCIACRISRNIQKKLDIANKTCSNYTCNKNLEKDDIKKGLKTCKSCRIKNTNRRNLNVINNKCSWCKKPLGAELKIHEKCRAKRKLNKNSTNSRLIGNRKKNNECLSCGNTKKRKPKDYCSKCYGPYFFTKRKSKFWYNLKKKYELTGSFKDMSPLIKLHIENMNALFIFYDEIFHKKKWNPASWMDLFYYTFIEPKSIKKEDYYKKKCCIVGKSKYYKEINKKIQDKVPYSKIYRWLKDMNTPIGLNSLKKHAHTHLST